MAPETPAAPCVFLVEDDPGVRRSLTLLIELANLELANSELASLRVEAFASGPEFLAAFDPSRRGCLVLDVHLPGMSGVDVHEQLVREGARIPTIFLTGHAPPEVSEDADGRGVVAVFEKPCPPDVLLDAIRKALGRE